MPPQDWSRLQIVFDEVVALEPGERESRLAVISETDPELHAQILSLLAADEQASEVLQAIEFDGSPVSPALDLAGARPSNDELDLLPRLRAALAARYEVEEEIGRGGMAVVFTAQDGKHDRRVALKVLRPEIANSLGSDRFLKEIRIAAGLTHPNILPLHDSGEADGLLYYVMPFVEGESLRERLRREHTLSIGDAARIAREVADGLGHAHALGIVHRDIKPGNVLLSGGHAVIADFGIARAMSAAGETHVTQTGMAFGTPAYMSPEQVASAEQLDGRSDIYSLGCVLYEMLTGESPYAATSARRVLAGHLAGAPASLAEARPDLPPAVEVTVEKALAKDPADRFATAEEFGEALSQALGESAFRAAEPRAIRPLAWAGRSWQKAAIASLLVLASGAVGMILWNPLSDALGGSAGEAGPADAANRVAILPFTYRGGEEHAGLREAMVDLLSMTLDGAGRWRTVEPRAVMGMHAQEVANDAPDVPLAVAQRLDAERYVTGEIVESGGRVRMTARLHGLSDSAEEALHVNVEGAADSLFGLVDGLTAQLLAGLGEGRAAPLVRTAAITTESLEALKGFLEGTYNSLDRAVELDSTFALAWYRLSREAVMGGGPALGRVVEAAEAAARHSANLPWRERQLVEANLAFAHGRADEAERIYSQILERDPADAEAWYSLAILRSRYYPVLGIPPTAIREPAERVLRYEPDRWNALWFVAFAEASDGNWERVDSLFGVMFDSRGPPPAFRLVRDFGTGNVEEQERHLAAAESAILERNVGNMRWANTHARNPRGSRKFARIFLRRVEEPDAKALAHLRLAEFELALGRWDAAREQLSQLARYNAAWALEDGAYRSLAPHLPVSLGHLEALRDTLERWDPDTAPLFVPSLHRFGVGLNLVRHKNIHRHLRLYLLGRLNERLGDGKVALRYADELEMLEAPDEIASLGQDLAQAIRAHVLAGQGRPEEALAALQSAPREVRYHHMEGTWAFTQPHEGFLRASLLVELGRYQEALSWYESLHNVEPESEMAGPTLLREAEIHERLGEEERAAQKYRRFIDQWRDCDLELQPLVEEAEQRLAAL